MQTRITAEQLLEDPEEARTIAYYLRYEAPDLWCGDKDGFFEKALEPDITSWLTLGRAQYLADLKNETLQYDRLAGYLLSELINRCLAICAEDSEEIENFIRETAKRNPIFVYEKEARKLLGYCRRKHIIEEFVNLY
ncbi:MAG: hypothetical protein AAF936_05645 [Pseudomonadota bacterium]